ncbi:hypothetical protein B0H10DRAFT_1951926 [Mycena sp. CBHHK59/15]|nr:hypothetical protein B0H10DRAFT_1951926 [Mycena sp. CBHHK59/15]
MSKADPSLWTAIRAKTRRHADFPKLMGLWLAHSHTPQLSLSLHGDLGPAVRDAMHENAHWVRDLELYLPSHHLEMSFPTLKKLTLGSRSSINYGDSGEFDPFNVLDCVTMMCGAPDLDGCTLDSAQYREYSTPISISNHPRLRDLCAPARAARPRKTRHLQLRHHSHIQKYSAGQHSFGTTVVLPDFLFPCGM